MNSIDKAIKNVRLMRGMIVDGYYIPPKKDVIRMRQYKQDALKVRKAAAAGKQKIKYNKCKYTKQQRIQFAKTLNQDLESMTTRMHNVPKDHMYADILNLIYNEMKHKYTGHNSFNARQRLAAIAGPIIENADEVIRKQTMLKRLYHEVDQDEDDDDIVYIETKKVCKLPIIVNPTAASLTPPSQPTASNVFVENPKSNSSIVITKINKMPRVWTIANILESDNSNSLDLDDIIIE